MKNDRNIKTLFFMFLSSILLFSCSKKYDLDLSNLPKPKKVIKTSDGNENTKSSNNQTFIKDLVPFNNKEKVLSQFKLGKKDPFSESEIQINKLSSDFKLTGFLNSELEKFVFVIYLGNEGSISENSVGGVNTNLLPNGAKVINIEPNAMRLTINYENENYVFEL